MENSINTIDLQTAVENMTVPWRIVTGCEVLTEGCDSCPSYTHARDNDLSYDVQIAWNRLEEPLKQGEPRIYQVAFGSDLFHEAVSKDAIKRIFDVMNKSNHHFEISTKRIERAFCVTRGLEFTPNIIMGCSVEKAEYKWRIGYLRKIPAAFRFLDMVPILGPMGELNLTGIHGVGACSEVWGLGRQADPKWIEEVRLQCEQQKVGFVSNKPRLWSPE